MPELSDFPHYTSLPAHLRGIVRLVITEADEPAVDTIIEAIDKAIDPDDSCANEIFACTIQAARTAAIHPQIRSRAELTKVLCAIVEITAEAAWDELGPAAGMKPANSNHPTPIGA